MYGSPPGRSFYSCKRNQNTLGALPQDPYRWLCWIRIDFGRQSKINPYCAQNRSQGSRSASALSPHPLSRGGKGARMGGRNQGNSLTLGVLGLAESQAADPWLWLAGLSVCRKREGVPLPRSGGGREGADAPAAPYKHRLAHAPGRRSRSGRAFRCVGFLGRSPK